MEACIIGRKIGMTSLYDDTGRLVPVTVVRAEPNVVVRRKTKELDGYSAIQVGAEAARLRRAPKAGKKDKAPLKRHGLSLPLAGQFVKAGVGFFKYLKEFRIPEGESYEPGQELTVEQFNLGDVLAVTATSKGRGFAGAVKRWHFHGGDMTHGSMIHRKPQSGGATDPARTFRGVKRPGRMGGDTVTIRSAKVFRVDSERSLLLIKGAVPGANGGLVTVRRLKAGKGEG